MDILANFKDQKGGDIDIFIGNYTGESDRIECSVTGSEPAIISYSGDAANILQPYILSNCTVQLVFTNEDDFTKAFEMLSNGDYNTLPVTVHKDHDLVWAGFVDPNIRQSDFYSPVTTLTIVCYDYLTATQYIPFDIDRGQVNIVGLVEELNARMSPVVGSTYVPVWYVEWVAKLRASNGADCNLNDLNINAEAFKKNDEQYSSCLDVLGEVAKMLSMTWIQMEPRTVGTAWDRPVIVLKEYYGTGNNSYLRLRSKGDGYDTAAAQIDITNVSRGTGDAIGNYKPYNNIEITNVHSKVYDDDLSSLKLISLDSLSDKVAISTGIPDDLYYNAQGDRCIEGRGFYVRTNREYADLIEEIAPHVSTIREITYDGKDSYKSFFYPTLGIEEYSWGEDDRYIALGTLPVSDDDDFAGCVYQGGPAYSYTCVFSGEGGGIRKVYDVERRTNSEATEECPDFSYATMYEFYDRMGAYFCRIGRSKDLYGHNDGAKADFKDYMVLSTGVPDMWLNGAYWCNRVKFDGNSIHSLVDTFFSRYCRQPLITLSNNNGMESLIVDVNSFALIVKFRIHIPYMLDYMQMPLASSPNLFDEYAYYKASNAISVMPVLIDGDKYRAYYPVLVTIQVGDYFFGNYTEEELRTSSCFHLLSSIRVSRTKLFMYLRMKETATTEDMYGKDVESMETSSHIDGYNNKEMGLLLELNKLAPYMSQVDLGRSKVKVTFYRPLPLVPVESPQRDDMFIPYCEPVKLYVSEFDVILTGTYDKTGELSSDDRQVVLDTNVQRFSNTERTFSEEMLLDVRKDNAEPGYETVCAAGNSEAVDLIYRTGQLVSPAELAMFKIYKTYIERGLQTFKRTIDYDRNMWLAHIDWQRLHKHEHLPVGTYYTELENVTMYKTSASDSASTAVTRWRNIAMTEMAISMPRAVLRVGDTFISYPGAMATVARFEDNDGRPTDAARAFLMYDTNGFEYVFSDELRNSEEYCDRYVAQYGSERAWIYQCAPEIDDAYANEIREDKAGNKYFALRGDSSGRMRGVTTQPIDLILDSKFLRPINADIDLARCSVVTEMMVVEAAITQSTDFSVPDAYRKLKTRDYRLDGSIIR